MTSHLLFTLSGRLQTVTLNRPLALNALNDDMIRGIERLCEQNDDHTLLITGAGDRAFCAGGDIKAAYAGGRSARAGAGSMEPVIDYFRHEYRMNGLLAALQRPTIAVMNGITMGGGVGVSAPCRYRIGCEATKWAMPETGIGFFPDVGSMYYLHHCPEPVGLFLAMTGHVVVSAAAMLEWGLITHFVPVERHADLFKTLAAATADDVPNILDDFHTPPPGRNRGGADDIHDHVLNCFEAGAPVLIREELTRAAPDYAAHLTGRSPHSVMTAFTYYRWATGRALADILAQDLHLARIFLDHPDFYEGVRAQVIDKDRAPRWQDASLEAVDPNRIAGYF
jgi:enoyl-CoA hydratase